MSGIPGNQGSLAEYGPMWGDIECDMGEKQYARNRAIYVPICEGILYSLII